MATTADVVARRSHRVAAPLILGAAVIAATAALHVRDPHEQGSWGICPTKVITGWDCPGCGGLRAVHHLSDGDLIAAASSNLLLVVAVPFLVLGWVIWLRRSWQGRPTRLMDWPAPVAWTAVAVIVIFTVLRNLPAGSWLAAG
ncbi:DUF2752 domain-containing protein [Nocardioides dubius]|uniref:DUF2752 domain-containing protein n=1 Tax=Nocardioides dubius TaxID=317019 RepID=A0ABN1TNS5_9ACTN